jgi:hypothetical protein
MSAAIICQLVGYQCEELVGKRHDDLIAPNTNDIPTIFGFFQKLGYMHGLWMLVSHEGTRILVRYGACLGEPRNTAASKLQPPLLEFYRQFFGASWKDLRAIDRKLAVSVDDFVAEEAVPTKNSIRRPSAK